MEESCWNMLLDLCKAFGVFIIKCSQSPSHCLFVSVHPLRAHCACSGLTDMYSEIVVEWNGVEEEQAHFKYLNS